MSSENKNSKTSKKHSIPKNNKRPLSITPLRGSSVEHLVGLGCNFG